MATPAPFSSRIRFGAFDLDAASGELRKAGILIKLRLQATQVLLMLTERAGQVVSREEIRERLWSADTFVDFERGINFCINQIRTALGDDAAKPRYVETLPRRGYRFIAPVTMEVSRESGPIVMIAPPSSQPPAPTGTQSATISTTSGMQIVPARLERPLATPWTKRYNGIVAAALILGSLAAGLATYKWLSRTSDPVLQDVRITKLTNSGAVTGVAISPDSRYVAYAKFDGERQGLWLHQIAAQSDVQILSRGTGFHGLTFSPDGNYIFFVRSDENNPWFKYLYSMPALGGPVKRLLTDVDSPVSFSPDGHSFVYQHCVEGRDDIELRISSTDGDNDHVLAVLHHGSSLLFQPGPSWSPDGHTIAVPVRLVGQHDGWVLEAVTVADASVRELFRSAGQIGRPVWVSGANLLIPLYDPAGHRGQLWTISFPEGKAKRFTNDLVSYGAPINDYGFPLDIARDRKTVVALASAEAANLWTATTAASSELQPITEGAPPLFSVRQAADGKLWAIGGDGQLWIMNPDGTQRTPYREFQSIASIAECGPFMILARREAGLETLVRLDRDGRHPKELTTANLFGPACSPNGQVVFYMTAEQPQKIWRVPVEGGAPVEIATVLGDQITSSPKISPDGTFIAYGYTVFVPTPGWFVAVIPAEGGAPRKTMPVPPTEAPGPYWSPDGKGLQYLWTRHGVTNLWEQPLAGGKPKQLTRFTSGLIFDFSWSSDHRRLLMTRGEIRSDAVLLSNLH